MLHLVFQSPISHALLARISEQDDVLFLQSALLSCLAGHAMETNLRALLHKECRLYVLEEDIRVYGIGSRQLMSGTTVVDYDGFVQLTVDNPQIKSWF